MNRYSWVAWVLLAGCGAAPGYEERPESEPLLPLEVSDPIAEIRSIEGSMATLELALSITNPNPVTLEMRRIDGNLLLDGRDAARIEVDGDEPFESDLERRFILEIEMPLTMLMGVHSEQFTARGIISADAGDGQGDLRSPFEIVGAVPRLQ